MQGKESNSRLTFCTSFILLFQHGNIWHSLESRTVL
jgi:hypothetical protein